MKEKGIGTVFLLWALWLIFSLCAMPAMAAEVETAVAEGLHTQQTGSLEWIALAASSLWALILQLLRLRK